jgi:hypothetical protein
MVRRTVKVHVADSAQHSGFGRRFLSADPASPPVSPSLGMEECSARMDVADSARDSGSVRSFFLSRAPTLVRSLDSWRWLKDAATVDVIDSTRYSGFAGSFLPAPLPITNALAVV